MAAKKKSGAQSKETPPTDNQDKTDSMADDRSGTREPSAGEREEKTANRDGAPVVEEPAAVGQLPDELRASEPHRPNFPIVGIGASAGGLEALTDLLANLPPEPPMAIVFVQHLDPRYHSKLVEILARATKMRVQEAADGTAVERGSLYVIPADRDLALMHGSLQLMQRPEGPARHLPIDYFFRSLAEDQGEIGRAHV